MPAPPPHPEAAAAPALTPGEQRVLDHRSSLWEAVPVAGAAVLSSARMSALTSGVVLSESCCGPHMPISSFPHGQGEKPAEGHGDTGTQEEDPALGLHLWASPLVTDGSALHLALSLLLAPCPFCHHDGCFQSLFSSFKPHARSHSLESILLSRQPGLKPDFCPRPTFFQVPGGHHYWENMVQYSSQPSLQTRTPFSHPFLPEGVSLKPLCSNFLT